MTVRTTTVRLGAIRLGVVKETREGYRPFADFLPDDAFEPSRSLLNAKLALYAAYARVARARHARRSKSILV